MMSKEEKKVLLETLQKINFSIEAIARAMVCQHTYNRNKYNRCPNCLLEIGTQELEASQVKQVNEVENAG